jgi:hypothetical protein
VNAASRHVSCWRMLYWRASDPVHGLSTAIHRHFREGPRAICRYLQVSGSTEAYGAGFIGIRSLDPSSRSRTSSTSETRFTTISAGAMPKCPNPNGWSGLDR